MSYTNPEQPTLQEALAEIDSAIEQYKEQIAFGEALARLKENPDYIMVVDKGYLEEEAERITGLIVGDDMLRRESIENIIDAALSIRNFKQFLKYKLIDASNAPHAIDENIQLRKDITAEFAADGEYEYIDTTVEA